MIITILSPDKVSLSMFNDFLNKAYSNQHTLDLNYLFGKDFINQALKDVYENHDKDKFCLVKLKTLVNTPISEGILSILKEHSDFIIKFDIYSNTPELLCSTDDSLIKPILDKWADNISSLNNLK